MAAVPPVTIATERLLLTQLPPEAAARMADFQTANREHLAPWEPPRPAAFFTEGYWREQLARNLRETADDVSLRLQLLTAGDVDGPVLGICNFTQIVRGPLQGCYLGFALHHGATGRGLMTEAAEAGIRFCFRELGLHRIAATHHPANERSARVLRRLGFVIEGYARDYLYVAGAWRDGVLTARTNPDAPVPTAP
jgi:ribosomal-protein-alanine N-acetyltransferase